MNDLEKCTVNQLRDKYQEQFGAPATSRNKAYLIRKLNGTARAPRPSKGTPKGTARLAETAEQMIRRLTKAKTPVRSICIELKKAGHKTKRGKKTWWPASVQFIQQQQAAR